MLLAIARVVAGFGLACVVAGATQVAFVAIREGLALGGDLLVLALLAATHSAIFAAPFAVIALAYGSWQGFSGPAFYVLVGTAIALSGFLAQFLTEAPGDPTIANGYAVATYLTSGLLGGLAASLFASRHGKSTAPEPAIDTSSTALRENP